MSVDIGFSSFHPTQTGNGNYVDAALLRSRFALAMSDMYKAEVPLYGDLVSIVQTVNQSVLDQEEMKDSIERITLERHGAIRLGSPCELQTVRRIFSLLGMHAIGYYDLSIAGLPMHATCFRPRDAQSLSKNPFRVFTTLLRPELLQSPEVREHVQSLLCQRKVFSDSLLDFLDAAETQGGRLNFEQAEIFVEEALKSFRWQSKAAATVEEYHTIQKEHPILSDIACFQTAHINHLTPRTLDIELSHLAMQAHGMKVKDRIEGPPKRQCPILLRQTSFLALREEIDFSVSKQDPGKTIHGYHKARFGEIEERGAAVTPAGRELYDKLFQDAMEISRATKESMDDALAHVFTKYPDEWTELRLQGLIYCEYSPTGKTLPPGFRPDEEKVTSTLERLIQEDVVTAKAITYEDFLPFSAAGIFQSNLANSPSSIMGEKESHPDKEGFEKSLGCTIQDPDILYANIQRKSIESCARHLGIDAFELLRKTA